MSLARRTGKTCLLYTSVHACGVIIGRYDISDVVPVSTAKDKDTGEEMLVTQYEGSVIEETGLILSLIHIYRNQVNRTIGG